MTHHPTNANEVRETFSRMDIFQNDHGLINNGSLYIPVNEGLAIFVFFTSLILAFVISTDATRRSRSGIVWGFATLIMPILTIPVYLVLISNEGRAKDGNMEISPTSNTFSSPVKAVQSHHIDQAYKTPTSVSVRFEASRQKAPQAISDETLSSETELGQEMQFNDVTKSTNQFCTTCGAKNFISSIYCNKCGNKIVN